VLLNEKLLGQFYWVVPCTPSGSTGGGLPFKLSWRV